MGELNGEWDIIISSLQDICQSNQSNSIDSFPVADPSKLNKLKQHDLTKLHDNVQAHKDNVDKSLRLILPVLNNLNRLISMKQQQDGGSSTSPPSSSATHTTGNNTTTNTNGGSNGEKSVFGSGSFTSGQSTAATSAISTAGKITSGTSKGIKKRRGEVVKKGKSYYNSPYNASEPILVGSEVAFRLKRSADGEEWIQCEVIKVIDLSKFEVRDPEPDENNKAGRTYRTNWKEVLLIPTAQEAKELVSYPFGAKVVARYPETTTFYPAEVIGTKRDGRCRLRFDGEEEVGKETEVERRLVLPYPDLRSHN